MRATQSVEFVTSATAPAHYPKALAHEFVFVGRSNVGKSSLLNALFFNQKLAKVSATPGKTRLINFFQWENCLFADVPGYGFARGPKAERRTWKAMMADYFSTRRPLELVFLLVDARHAISPLDLDMEAYLIEAAIPYVLILTKWDALSQSERSARLREYTDTCGAHPPIAFSAKTRVGVRELWKVIHDHCAA